MLHQGVGIAGDVFVEPSVSLLFVPQIARGDGTSSNFSSYKRRKSAFGLLTPFLSVRGRCVGRVRDERRPQ